MRDPITHQPLKSPHTIVEWNWKAWICLFQQKKPGGIAGISVWWTERWTLEDTGLEFVYRHLRKGGGSPFHEVSLCRFGLCLQSLPQMRTMVWRPSRSCQKSVSMQKKNKKGSGWMRGKWFSFLARNETKPEQCGGCFVLGRRVKEAWGLHVFGGRLKIKTGRAKFRETGKVMQGNGRRHQPAHRRLG